MEWLSATFYFITICLLLIFSKRLRLPGLPAYTSMLLFIVQCIVSVLAVWIYSSVYTQDSQSEMYYTFQEGLELMKVSEISFRDFLVLITGLDHGNPYYDSYLVNMPNWNSELIHGTHHYLSIRAEIRWHAIVHFISGGAFPVHLMLSNFLAFCGLITLYKYINKAKLLNPTVLAVSVFLIPTVLFWTSTGLIDSLQVFSLCRLSFLIFHCKEEGFSFKKATAISAHIAILYIIQPLLLIALFPGVLVVLIESYFPKLGIRFLSVLSLIVCCVAFWILGSLQPSLNLLNELSSMQQNQIHLAEMVNAGSLVHIQALEPVVWSFFRNFPESILNAAFRPGILDAKNGLQWLASFENTGFVVLVILSIGLYKKPQNRLSLLIFWFLISFAFMHLSLVGFSNPILGALVRYRLPGTLFFVVALLIITDLRRLKLILFELFNYGKGDNSDFRSNIGDR